MPASSDYTLLAATKRSGNGAAAPMNVQEIFGTNTFSRAVMKSRLPKNAYKSIVATLERGAPLDADVADTVALAMKEWAVEKGATHYTHWFQPLTGLTAEKHDSFITPNEGGGAIAEFSGKDLIQGEPDASSFPNAGMRPTFEARGYTAWDPTSPAFIMENPNGKYLCIPTAFASWKGDALDFKTPLLRSMQALDQQARRALALFGVPTTKVYSTVGNEQEYFLIDEEFYYRRPDLVTCGRTLFGAPPPKGQELDDHYFGTIPERILSCMLEVEQELYKLGVPVKTRHNEVAPSQYEIAPIFENANVACDHQQLLMITLQNVARRHGLVCLLHEKPFAGVNGSGKHNNWSMSTADGANLLDPGDTPHDNMQFLFFCTAVIRAVHKHQDLLLAAIASAANDHRLGANEAPPAIISMFMGDQLTDVFEQIAGGGAESSKESGLLGLGVDTLPTLPRHAGDRNRTSPLAFTGNKFEFRALGSSSTPSFTNTVLNVAVAEALDDMATMLEEKLGDDRSEDALQAATSAVLKEVITEAMPVIFNGDNYADAWQTEAAERGLLNIPSAMDALHTLVDAKNAEVFGAYDVLSEQELTSRHDIFLEQYALKLNIEANTTEDIARTRVMPAAVRYLRELIGTVDELEDLDLDATGTHETAGEVNDAVNELRLGITLLHKELHAVEEHEEAGVLAHATHMRDAVTPAMNAVRAAADTLERLVPADTWPMPTYRDILFVK